MALLEKVADTIRGAFIDYQNAAEERRRLGVDAATATPETQAETAEAHGHIGFIAILTASAAERFLRQQRAGRRELEGVEQRPEEVTSRLDEIDARDKQRR